MVYVKQLLLTGHGHPVVSLSSGHELDVLAMAHDRVNRGAPLLASAYAGTGSRSFQRLWCNGSVNGVPLNGVLLDDIPVHGIVFWYDSNS